MPFLVIFMPAITRISSHMSSHFTLCDLRLGSNEEYSQWKERLRTALPKLK